MNVGNDALWSYTRNGVPIFPSVVHAPLERVMPIATMATERLEDSRFNVSTPRYTEGIAPAFEKLYVRMDSGVKYPLRV